MITSTLLGLDYDTEDIVERLKELTVAEYSETNLGEIIPFSLAKKIRSF